VRFVVDECIGRHAADWLVSAGHQVIRSPDQDLGASDESILDTAVEHDCILVTCDKDFGDLVFRQALAHHGVILLRLKDEHPTTKVAVLSVLIERYGDLLRDAFVVASEQQVRFGKSP
jgi:predicted nuclease of predicted toxin-antitoxin system